MDPSKVDGILTVVLRISAVAAVTQCYIQIPIRAEHNLPRIMITVRLGYLKNDRFA